MPFINVDGMLVFDTPSDDVLDFDVINAIADHTMNTMCSRNREAVIRDTVQGKKAEHVIEEYLQENSGLRYLSYDVFRTDNYESHAPFDGLIYRNDTPAETLEQYKTRINNEVRLSGGTGHISPLLRSDIAADGILIFEIKSSRLRERNGDYKDVARGAVRTPEARETIVRNMRRKWDYFIFPHNLRHVDDDDNIATFSEYIDRVARNERFAGIADRTALTAAVTADEYANASDIYTRVFYDDEANEIYAPGYVHKHVILGSLPQITRMSGDVSGSTLYFTRSLITGKSFTEIDGDENLWNDNIRNGFTAFDGNMDSHTCPRCGGVVRNGMYGWYCVEKCGMQVGKFFGTPIPDEAISALLKGSAAEFRSEHGDMMLFPTAVFTGTGSDGREFYGWKKTDLRG